MTDHAARALLGELEQALGLLKAYDNGNYTIGHETLPSLLEQCEAFGARVDEPEPVRTIHHLACVGGSLFSKLLSAMPNTVLLSEVDPLSTMNAAKGAQLFTPSNLVYQMCTAFRPVSAAGVEQVFRAGVQALLTYLAERGQHLVLRDHSHSQFHTTEDASSRPTLHEIIVGTFPVRSVVTVRHPLDSFLALLEHGWVGFSPRTLEEYARRYMSFLDRHHGIDLFRYEDLVADPSSVMQKVCAGLCLPWSPEAQLMLRHVRVSGDSGRSGSIIEPRDRRPLPEGFADLIGMPAPYEALCARLGYVPDL